MKAPKNMLLVAAYSIITSSLISAQTLITVNNKSDQPIYAAVYKQPIDTLKEATRFTDPLFVEPDKSGKLKRINLSVINKLWYNNLLVFTPNKERLNPILTYTQIKELGSVKVGPLQGKQFYIYAKPLEELKGYNAIYWKALLPVIEKIKSTALSPFRSGITKVQEEIINNANNPWTQQVAKVRIVDAQNPELAEQEKEYLEKRVPKVKEAQKKFLNQDINQPLKVGITLSGGGFRAMMLSAATIATAEQSGLMDTLSYLTALSGSTWSMAPWYCSNLSAQDFLNALEAQATQGIQRVAKNILKIPDIISKLVTNIKTSLASQQALSLIDMYGYALGRIILENTATAPGGVKPSADSLALYNQVERIKEGGSPFPLYVASLANTSTADKPGLYQWVEFSPYEVLSEYLRGGVNSWAFGRRFNNGVSVNNTAPYALGYLMGVWGSASSVSVKDIYDQLGVKNTIWGLRHLAELIVKTELGDVRLSPANISNYTYGMATSPFSEKEKITLIDAGISANNPVYPLLNKNRDLDIIIVCDFSQSVTNALELKKAIDLARARGYKMPTINYQQAAQQICSVWSDPDPTVPTIIYLPRIKNAEYNEGFDPETITGLRGYANAANFAYTKKQFDDFVGLMKYNLNASLGKIKEAMKNKLNQKEAAAQPLPAGASIAQGQAALLPAIEAPAK